MKKIISIIILFSLVITCTACNIFSRNTHSNQTGNSAATPISSNIKQDTEQTSSEWTEYSQDSISYKVDSSWVPFSDEEGVFITTDQKTVYMVQGISPLGSYTPDEFYQSLINRYTSQYNLIYLDASLSYFTADDNTDCAMATMKLEENDVYYLIDLIIAKDKNIVVTFASQCASDDDARLEPIHSVSQSITYNIGNTDYISGNTFINTDGSELCLNSDGTFNYYRYEGDHENQYYTGTYEVYYGQPAIDKIASMTEYGLTKEELEDTLSANMKGYIPGNNTLDYLYSDSSTEYYQVCKDTFYCLILHHEELVNSPDDRSPLSHSTLYFGFYIPELQMADMLNANSATQFQFTLKTNTPSPKK
ncbi:MAG: hypothetical protein J6B50_05655 [Lachnospiraceae bacterium]|nr:hypothetical protein [Lachnospiraceae bacterium]MBP3507566.1 hypothetical protein [Lachnospiraceae bacterium]